MITANDKNYCKLYSFVLGDTCVCKSNVFSLVSKITFLREMDTIDLISNCPWEIKCLILEKLLPLLDPRDRYLLKKDAERIWQVRLDDQFERVCIPWPDGKLPIKYFPSPITFVSAHPEHTSCLNIPLRPTVIINDDNSVELDAPAYMWYYHTSSRYSTETERYFLFYTFSEGNTMVYEFNEDVCEWELCFCRLQTPLSF